MSGVQNVLFFSFFHVASRPYLALREAQNIHWTRHGLFPQNRKSDFNKNKR